MNTILSRGIVYDANAVSRILGLPYECSDPVPDTVEGEIVIYYGGWDLRTLRNCTAGKKRMSQDLRVDEQKYDSRRWGAEPGCYRLNLRVPGSNLKNGDEQLAHLRTIEGDWQPAPVAVAAAALLIHLTETENDLLQGSWSRCAEMEPSSLVDRTMVSMFEGRLIISPRLFGDVREDFIWLAASRKF